MRNTMIMRAGGALVVALALSVSAGCVRVELPEGAPQSTEESVPVGGATELDVSVDMGAGELDISGGAVGAMDADFEYTQAAWRPEVEYDVVDGTGELSVKTPEIRDFSLIGNHRYAWDIRLADTLPLNLAVNMGAGESDLKLDGTSLRDLQVNLGAGDTMIDLSGDWDHDLVADINAGAGELVLRVPANVGVRVVGYQDGVGSYRANGFEQDGDALVNDAYETASVKFDITLRRGFGDVTIETVD